MIAALQPRPELPPADAFAGGDMGAAAAMDALLL
jgi:hypothetical protein